MPIDASRAILWWSPRNGVKPYDAPNLYWATQSRCPVGQSVVSYSTEDKPEFAYDPFNDGRDFGPLDAARTVMYCRWVDRLCSAHADCDALVHVSSDAHEKVRVNSVVLCCAYAILAKGLSAEDAFKPFASEPLHSFLDCRGEHVSSSEISSGFDAEFELPALDVLRGLEHARDLRWIDYLTFDVEEHSSTLRPERGDMSWLIPGKALAFASPWNQPQDQDGLPVCTPTILSSCFLRHDVQLVVQCNDPVREEKDERKQLLNYDGSKFEEAGIRHIKLAFDDGGCPPVQIVLAFFEAVDSLSGTFAVHCRSGLGRTGTLIALYAMRNLGFSARSFIGWARIMRPGTVHGSQQQYLVNLEQHVKPTASRTLASLDQRERLNLLPRRELRFWALDSGIDAERTKLSSHAEIVNMMLAAAGSQVPERLLVQKSVSLTEAPPSKDSEMCGELASTVMQKHPSRLVGLKAAIASLRSGTNGEPQSHNIGVGSRRDDDRGMLRFDEWDEFLRYVDLMIAIHKDDNLWEGVKLRIERLRASCNLGGEPQEDRVASAECASRDAEFDEVLEESLVLQRECDELRSSLASERQQRLLERKSIEERSDALERELHNDMMRLEQALRDVQHLREQVFGHGQLEQCQIDSMARLRSQVNEVREETITIRAMCQEKQIRTDIVEEQQRRRDALTRPAIGQHGSQDIGRNEGSRCGGMVGGVLGVEEDDFLRQSAKNSIEQLRSRFQDAVMHARLTIRDE
eukprot:TRINITY_DN32717_c0_g1_i1.p1 TRINITY_DN32717_c0_g1~~TRINITY_DN32717_c0_g1_i1.p1  ORF type:complete len:746 (+),score=140.88 TRINITY_DN32717_c0_g1_i1:207-2444(+)